jgi:hypothetical protein
MSMRALLIVAAGLALNGVGAHADDVASAATPAAAAPAKLLDLRPPEITKLYSSEQLAALLEKLEREHIENVEVEGAPVPPPSFTPRVWPAIAAPFWALLHPTQAWRILAPIPPDQARDIGARAPDTEGYLEPAGIPPGPFEH